MQAPTRFFSRTTIIHIVPEKIREVLVKGFSLIELLIVISIVGILSAIAVPAYSNYMVRTQISNIQKVINSFMDSSIAYYGSHDNFPMASQIGLVASGDEFYFSVSPGGYMIGAYLDNSYPSINCNHAELGAYISDFGRGNYETDPDGDWINYYAFAIDDNNVIKKFCFYTYRPSVSGSPVSGDIIPGCYNTADDPDYMDLIKAQLGAECQ